MSVLRNVAWVTLQAESQWLEDSGTADIGLCHVWSTESQYVSLMSADG